MLRASVLAAVFASTALPALAQTDMAAMAHRSAANQLGLMEYCKGQGFVGDDAIAAQRESMSLLPASSASTADAEAAGKSGNFLVPNGTTMAMSAMASQHGSTVESMCKQMASATAQATSAMRQNGLTGAPGTMPAMNGMPAMPAMPSGMPSMPTMPGMPAAPSK